MKFFAVCVKDLAADTFGAPFTVPRPEVALRQFANEVNRVDEKNPMFTNPEHFELYQVGMFDDETAFFVAECHEGTMRPKLLARAQELKRVVN